MMWFANIVVDHHACVAFDPKAFDLGRWINEWVCKQSSQDHSSSSDPKT